jgi:hypothetical protein
MQGKPAQADVAPPQPPSGALRCPGPLDLQLARELTRRSRRPLIKQNETPKMGPLRQTTGMSLPSICGSCRFVWVMNPGTVQHSLSCAPQESRFFARSCPRNITTDQNPDLTLKRFEIRHDIHYLARRKLKPRHRRMNSLKQRSLQICNWISEAQCAKWGRIRKATPADFTDGVTLRAILGGMADFCAG